MVNTILDATTVALHNTFGDTYTYYVEDVEQNATKPCFVVGMLNPLLRSTKLDRYYRTMPLIIHYFTDKDNTLDAKKDCYDVAEKLAEALEFLPVEIEECTIMGRDISWEIVEGVLQFYITYNFYVERVREHIYMEDGKYNGVALNKQKG